MDTKSLGYIIGNMGENDRLDIVEMESGNRYKIDGATCHLDFKQNKNVVTFYIKVNEKNGRNSEPHN